LFNCVLPNAAVPTSVSSFFNASTKNSLADYLYLSHSLLYLH
jgi:hypothetical protein